MTAPELRVDTLTGLRSIVGADGAGLSPDAPVPAPQTPADLFTALPARGTHEALPARSGVPATLENWRERISAHAAEGAACVHLAADRRLDAQLHALDFVPAAIARERERFGAYAVRTMGQNLLGDLVQEEVRRRDRLVAVDEDAVVLAPYASRSPYQLLLAPRRPRARFEDEGPTGAALLEEALGRLGRVLGAETPLDLWVRTAPRGADAFCWRIDVVPQPGPAGGLELGTGLNVCATTPETAAARLRDA